jgi:outer membrane protein assembly factor BamB/chitodextrinase
MIGVEKATKGGMSGSRRLRILFYVIILSALVLQVLPNGLGEELQTESQFAVSSQTQLVPQVDSWPMYGHDVQHTGHSAFDAPDDNSLLWTFDAFTLDLELPPLCIGWPMSSASAADGMVFVTFGEPCVAALDEDTGEIIWWQEIPGWVSQPVVDDGKVYVANVYLDGSGPQPPEDPLGIHVFDEHNGTELDYWEIEIDDVAYNPPVITVANGKIFVGETAYLPPPSAPFPYTIFAFDQATGDLLWQRGIEYEPNGMMSPQLPVTNGMIIVSTGTPKLCALDENTGDKVWEVDMAPEVFRASSAAHNGKIFVATDNGGKVYALDDTDGSVLWSYQTGLVPGNNNYSGMKTPAVADGKVFVGYESLAGGVSGDTGAVIALDENTGDLLWESDVMGGATSSPSVADGKVFMNTPEGVAALDMNTGDVVWTYIDSFSPMFLGWFEHSPAIAFGKLFVVNNWDDALYAFGPGGSQPPEPNLPPVADVQPEFQEVDVGEMAHFNASASYDPDGNITSYEWDFGDGTFGNGMIVSHEYNIAGPYFVILTVTDDDNDTGWDFATVEVKEMPEPENEPPIADAQPSVQVVQDGEMASFDAFGSYDPDGHIVSYVWDFGDGGQETGVEASHVYPGPGNYTVTLTVTDNDGATGTDTALVTVEEIPEPENEPPIAQANPGFQEVFAGEEAYLDASGSYDPDGYIVSYEWDFGMGITKTGITASHVYEEPGNYTLSLKVTDNDGAVACDFATVLVEEKEEPPEPGALGLSKMKISGDDVVFTHAYNEWTLEVTISNPGGSLVSEVLVFDVLPAEFELMNHVLSQGILTVQKNHDKMNPTFLVWFVGTLMPGDEATLTMTVGTVENPAGKQEFTSPGAYPLNEGASALGMDGLTAELIKAGPTDAIMVSAVEEETEQKPEVPPTVDEPDDPLLILTAGLRNIATFEECLERTVPIEVTAYYGDVHDVRIELVDDGGLEIEIIPMVQDVLEGTIVKFYVKITVPELPDDAKSNGITIELKAVGIEASSNVEYLDVLTRSDGSSWNLELTAVASTAAVGGSAALFTLLARRRTIK